MNLYRIHYVHHHGSEIDYYDDNDERFKADLLRLSLEVQRETSGRDWLKLITASYWREHLFGRDDDNILRRAKRIIKVEKIVDNEWVPVAYEFIEPEVRLT